MALTAVYNPTNHDFKLYDASGKQIFLCLAWNDSVANNAWRSDHGCPPGTFDLGAPEANTTDQDKLEMGPWFIPVYNIPGHDGIGIHGGGSCNGTVAAAMADHQQICPTLNCFRLFNVDLVRLVNQYGSQLAGAQYIVN